MARFLITGTDTGAGKTYFTALLLSELRKRGVSVSALKPIETGCVEGPEGLVAADVEVIRAALGLEARREPGGSDELIVEKFVSPVAPSIAAKAEGRSLNWSELVSEIDRRSNQYPNFLIEGAGGLMVPIVPGKTYVDLARELELVLIIVVGSKLGAINHACLSLHAARSLELNLLGYVFNDLDPEQGRDAVPVNAKATNRGLLSEEAKRFGAQEIAFMPFREAGYDNLQDVLSSQSASSLGVEFSKQLLENFS